MIYKSESGRSMVEILGVLAVIGLLSVTGINGYTTAMNKHKANEVLDLASKLATSVSGQIQRGVPNPTLDEFGDDISAQGVIFGVPEKQGEKQFKLPLDWAALSDEQKKTLCKYIKQMIPEDGEGSTGQVDTNCTRIVYNNDLSVGATISNNTNYDSQTGKCKLGYYGTDCDTQCPYSHQESNDDNTGCKCETGYTGDTCGACDSNQHRIKDTVNGGCKCEAGYHEDSSGACVNTCTLWTTNECGTGYYCKFNSYTISGSCTAGNKYYQNLTGTCTENPSSTKDWTVYNGTNTSLRVYKYRTMNWWSAYSLCLSAHNGMISLSDYGITTQSNASLKISNITCACGTHGASCTGDSTTGCSSGTCNCWTYLKSLDKDSYWTTNEYESGACDTSRNAFIVVTSGGNLNASSRGSGYYALCK